MKKGSGREPGGGRSIAGAALILLLILLGVGAFTFHLYTRIVNESKTLAWEMTLKSAEVMELRLEDIRSSLAAFSRSVASSGAGPGEVGEIQVKGVPGRTVMKGYFRNPEATAAAFTEDGWLRTGDKGYMDESGWFFFVDRKANMIKRAGENISAGEVENVLECHPAIAESAVIGVPDPIRDQAVKAFVRLEAGARLTEEEVRAHCEERLAPFKVPSLVEFVEDFPRTCSMKIEKKLLS